MSALRGRAGPWPEPSLPSVLRAEVLLVERWPYSMSFSSTMRDVSPQESIFGTIQPEDNAAWEGSQPAGGWLFVCPVRCLSWGMPGAVLTTG